MKAPGLKPGYFVEHEPYELVFVRRKALGGTPSNDRRVRICVPLPVAEAHVTADATCGTASTAWDAAGLLPATDPVRASFKEPDSQSSGNVDINALSVFPGSDTLSANADTT